MPDSPRQYIEITPTTDEPRPDTLRRAFEDLALYLDRHTQTGLRARLRGETDQPVVEHLFASTGGDDADFRWLVGITPLETDTDPLDRLDGKLRYMLPRSYDRERVDFHPRTFLEEHAETPLDDSHVAGIQVTGETSAARDWLLPLVAPGSRPRYPADPTPIGVDWENFPLTKFVNQLTMTDCPVVYQLACRTHGPWRDEAIAYHSQLKDGNVTRVDRIADHHLTETIGDRLAIDIDDLADQLPDKTNEAADDELMRIINRMDRLDVRAWEGFAVSVRAAVCSDTPEKTARTVAKRLPHGGTHAEYHSIEGHVVPGDAVLTDLVDRQVPDPTYERLTSPFSLRGRSEAIVMTAAELPTLCVVDGARFVDLNGGHPRWQSWVTEGSNSD